MKVTAEQIPEARVVLEVEVDDERFRESMDWAYRRLSLRAKIPGFRRGKAPRELVERVLGRERLLQEAADHMVPKAYEDAIAREGIDPIAQPEIEILNLEPLRFKATVPVRPSVSLGDYRSIRLQREPVVVADDQIADTLLELRRRHAVLEPVDRPVEYNDRIRIDIQGESDGKPFAAQEGVEISLRETGAFVVPGLAERIVGLAPGPDRHRIEIDIPEDFDHGELAGKAATFTVTVHEVKRELLPDLDDDFASEVGEFETFEALHARVVADLRAGLEQRVETDFSDALLDTLAAQATVEYPALLVDREIEHMLTDAARGQGQSLEAYLQALGSDPQEIAQRLRPEASKRVLRSILIAEVAETESIEVSDADIDAEIARMAGQGPEGEQVRAAFDTEAGRTVLRQNLTTKRTLERLASIAEQPVAADGEMPSSDGHSAEPANETPIGNAAKETE
ncbi:MAG: trigger factor [Chloroflexi bacterium]|nr:trigger factor [Chloroflexota bacterium]